MRRPCFLTLLRTMHSALSISSPQLPRAISEPGNHTKATFSGTKTETLLAFEQKVKLTGKSAQKKEQQSKFCPVAYQCWNIAKKQGHPPQEKSQWPHAMHTAGLGPCTLVTQKKELGQRSVVISQSKSCICLNPLFCATL